MIDSISQEQRAMAFPRGLQLLVSCWIVGEMGRSPYSYSRMCGVCVYAYMYGLVLENSLAFCSLVSFLPLCEGLAVWGGQCVCPLSGSRAQDSEARCCHNSFL